MTILEETITVPDRWDHDTGPRKSRPLWGATILLYAQTLDPHLQQMTELADRGFFIYSEQAPAKGRRPRRRCQEPRER